MNNSSSSSKLHISQEIENPSSFNFSIPLPEESPSTPVVELVRRVNPTHLTLKWWHLMHFHRGKFYLALLRWLYPVKYPRTLRPN
ncbi:hypothetical protein H5410_045490 [Solanum commersonii]|uniref:Uncharacterized protein n=1 Tax=Solanum commersonii TaxID=4109 RepID=A0A9J5XDT5_SOLCO|nr:hypothetical protein H5410_045490 [Solanum commersonii]